jgi:hypothetical protein
MRPGFVIVAVFAAAAAVVASGRGEAATACSAGVHPFGSVTARTFCGPAKATIVVGGKTFRIGGGTCQRGAAYVAVNIGTVVLGTTSKPKPEYFGLVVGKAPMVGGTPARTDGTYAAQALTANHAGAGYAVLGSTVRLQGNRTRGTFSGTTFGKGLRITGSFSC